MLWFYDHAAEDSEELPLNVVQGVTADPDDYIAGVAYLAQAGFIVSGDPHLTNLNSIRRSDGGIIARILTPRAFLDELN